MWEGYGPEGAQGGAMGSVRGYDTGHGGPTEWCYSTGRRIIGLI